MCPYSPRWPQPGPFCCSLLIRLPAGCLFRPPTQLFALCRNQCRCLHTLFGVGCRDTVKNEGLHGREAAAAPAPIIIDQPHVLFQKEGTSTSTSNEGGGASATNCHAARKGSQWCTVCCIGNDAQWDFHPSCGVFVCVSVWLFVCCTTLFWNHGLCTA